MANFFSRLFGAPEKRALDSDELLRIFGAIPTTAAGIAVNAETALRSPTVLAAVKAISETSGMLPIAVRRRKGTGWEKVTNHPASNLLNRFSSPWCSSEQLRTQLAVDALLHRGGGFAQVIRVRGEPKELHRLHPNAVAVKVNDDGSPSYEVANAGGGTTALPWRDVIHLQAPGSTVDRSMCPTVLARDAIALDILLTEHEAKIFSGGGLPRLFLSPESGDITPEALAKAMAFVAKQMSKNIGEPVMLPASFKDSVKSFGLVEMAFAELRRLSVEDVARTYRTPLMIVGDLSRATYSNGETMGRQFLQLCLLPWLESWESGLTRALIDPADREDVELEFVVEDLLRGDTAARFTAYRNATGGAWMAPNEARELEGRQPVPGGDELIRQAGQSDAAGTPKPEEP